MKNNQRRKVLFDSESEISFVKVSTTQGKSARKAVAMERTKGFRRKPVSIELVWQMAGDQSGLCAHTCTHHPHKGAI